MKLMEIRNINSTPYNGDIFIPHTAMIKSPMEINTLPEFENYQPYCMLYGNFKANKMMETLEGSPVFIFGNMSCSNTRIRSLVGSPQQITGKLIFQDSMLRNLKGLPKIIGDGIYMGDASFLTNIKDLWECKVTGEVKISKSHHSDFTLDDAVDIMMRHKKLKTKNYMEVMREARDRGLEDFFK